MNVRVRFVALAAAALSVTITGVAPAQTAETPMLDPWVPPALRKTVPKRAVVGAELKATVERKLRESFEAADVARSGTLTREQASAAGFGFVANNFDRIDTAGTGRVTFDDLKRYLRAQGADL